MDVGAKVDARLALDALGGQAAVVDPLHLASPLQGLVGLLGPGFPRGDEPIFGLEGAGLERSAEFRLGSVGPLEPLGRLALDPVVGSLAHHQVTVRVAAPAGVDRQGVGQLLGVGQLVGEVEG